MLDLNKFCKEHVEGNGPAHKYCLGKLRKLEYKAALFILSDELGDLAQLRKILLGSSLTTMQEFQYTKAKIIIKIRSQYLGDTAHFSESMQNVSSSTAVHTKLVITWIKNFPRIN